MSAEHGGRAEPEGAQGPRARVRDEHHAPRHDEPLVHSQKSRDVILAQQSAQAEEELRRPTLALLLSGFTAGLDLGFGPFAMGVGGTLMRDVLSPPVVKLLEAGLYTIGFVFVVLGRSALFTEHTTSAMQPVLARRVSVGRLLRLWSLVLVANVVGGALFSFGGATLGQSLDIVDPHVLGEIARRVIDKPAGVMFLSAIAAGWIMGLLSWLLASSRETTAQIVVVFITTGLIALAGLHHSIAGTVEILLAVFAGAGATWTDFGRFMLLAVPGNVVGGAVFVALLKYGSVRQGDDG